MSDLQAAITRPLNLYSIFGYLLPGFFFTTLIVVDYDFSAIIRLGGEEPITLTRIKGLDLKTNYLLDFFSSGTLSDFKVIPFAVYLFFCYLMGHVISAISSLFIERMLVKHTMGFPSSLLIGGKEVKNRFIFGNYRRPFKSQLIEELKKEVKNVFGYDVNKDDYYWLMYSYIISSRPQLAPRVHHFVNLYGFSRNVSATLVIYITIRVAILTWLLKSPIDCTTAVILGMFALMAFFMFWNYLKLFKRQAVDIYFLFLSSCHTKSDE